MNGKQGLLETCGVMVHNAGFEPRMVQRKTHPTHKLFNLLSQNFGFLKYRETFLTRPSLSLEPNLDPFYECPAYLLS